METAPESKDPTPATEGRPSEGPIGAKAGFVLFAVVGLLVGVVVARPGGLVGKPIEFDLATDGYVGTHNFQITIEGRDVINTEVVKVSGAVSTTRLGKPLEYAPIVIERVYKGVDAFYNWRVEVEGDTIRPANVTITMMDSSFRAVRKMQLEAAWPSKWEMPDMDASSSGPAIERITLTAARVQETAP